MHSSHTPKRTLRSFLRQAVSGNAGHGLHATGTDAWKCLMHGKKRGPSTQVGEGCLEVLKALQHPACGGDAGAQLRQMLHVLLALLHLALQACHVRQVHEVVAVCDRAVGHVDDPRPVRWLSSTTQASLLPNVLNNVLRVPLLNAELP